LVNFLKANKSLYPQFTDKLNTDSDIKPTRSVDNGYDDFMIMF
jgi:hypothetical protein